MVVSQWNQSDCKRTLCLIMKVKTDFSLNYQFPFCNCPLSPAFSLLNAVNGIVCVYVSSLDVQQQLGEGISL